MTVATTTIESHAACSPRPLTSTQVTPILRSGILAREFCRQGACEGARAEVAAVFERSLYLRGGDAFICLGQPSIGNGPLTLIADFSPAGLRRGQSVSISDRCIAIGSSAQFTFDHCDLWRSPHWPSLSGCVELIDVGRAIAGVMVVAAPPEGLARVQEQGSCDTPLARIVRSRIASFQSWLRDALETDDAIVASPEVIQGLIGLGPGLTPSGDDFLVGALALLDALAETKAHAALADAINISPRGLTSPLSGCLLRAAAAGHVGEHLCRAVAAVVTGQIDAAVAAIRNIGHSSGWDMLAGVTATLEVVATARSPGSRHRP
jgi:Protein of unknown function (DUF2877)